MKNKKLIILLSVIIVLIWSSIFYLYQSWRKLSDDFSEEVKIQLNSIPLIQDHIGEINSIEIDLSETGLLDNPDTFVFQIEGNKSNGVTYINLKTDTEIGQKIISGTLYLPSGESFKLLNNPNVPYKILKSNTDQKSTQNAELPLNEIKRRVFQAASNGNAKYVKILLSKGVKPDVKKGDTGATLLHVASLRGHIDVVELLVLEGANINSTNNKGQTPLSFAISRNHHQIVEFLVNNGAKTTDELMNSDVLK